MVNPSNATSTKDRVSYNDPFYNKLSQFKPGTEVLQENLSIVKKTGLAAAAGFLGLGSSLPGTPASRLKTISNLTAFIQQNKKELEKLGPALPKITKTFRALLKDLSPEEPELNGYNADPRLHLVYHNFNMAILGLEEEPLDPIARAGSPVDYGDVLHLDGHNSDTD